MQNDLVTGEFSPEVGLWLPICRGNWKQPHTQSSTPWAGMRFFLQLQEFLQILISQGHQNDQIEGHWCEIGVSFLENNNFQISCLLGWPESVKFRIKNNNNWGVLWCKIPTVYVCVKKTVYVILYIISRLYWFSVRLWSFQWQHTNQIKKTTIGLETDICVWRPRLSVTVS